MNKQKIYIYGLVCFIIVLMHGYNYSMWNYTFWGWITNLTYIVLIISVLLFGHKGKEKTCIFDKIVVALIVFHSTWCISAIYIYNESIFKRPELLLSGALFLMYNMFKDLRFKEKDLIKVFFIIAIIGFVIQVVQQVFPSHAVFGIYKQGEYSGGIAMIRNDLYRWRLPHYYFTLICTYFMWQKFISKKKGAYLYVFVLLLVSLYLTLIRQILFATVIALVSTILFYKGNQNKKASMTIILFLFLASLYAFSDALFGKLIDDTSTKEGSYTARMLAASFFGEKVFDNMFTILFGNGFPASLDYWKDTLKIYTNDVGFIGEAFHYGVIWVLLYFYTIYLVCVKYSSKIPLYVKLFCFGTFVNSLMIFPYTSQWTIILWVAVLYISELYVKDKKNMVLFKDVN